MGREEVEQAREEVEDAAAGLAVARRATRQRGRARVAID